MATCQDCAHWVRNTYADAGKRKDQDRPVQHPKGICHRFPSPQPTMDAGDFCGEWKHPD